MMEWDSWLFYLAVTFLVLLASALVVFSLVALDSLVETAQYSLSVWRGGRAQEEYLRRLACWEPHVTALDTETARQAAKATLARSQNWACSNGPVDADILLLLADSVRDFFGGCTAICDGQDECRASLEDVEPYPEDMHFLIIGYDCSGGHVVVCTGEDTVYETHGHADDGYSEPFDMWKPYPTIYHWFLVKDLQINSHPYRSAIAGQRVRQ